MKDKIIQELRKMGYIPELDSHPLYVKVLKDYLGPQKATKFLKRIDNIINTNIDEKVENSICDLIGSDDKLLKLVYSTDIRTSIEIFDDIINTIKSLHIRPKSIIDFGGANGWSLYLLEKFFSWKCEKTVIDKNPAWSGISDDIEYHCMDYSDFATQSYVDLSISIFGAPASNVIPLLQSAVQCTAPDGYFIGSLRIPNEEYYLSIVGEAALLGFELDLSLSHRFIYNDEKFPILVFRKRASQVLQNGQLLQALRKGFYNYSAEKSVFGFESQILLHLLKRCTIRFHDTYEGVNLTIYSMQEVYYKVIEYPDGQILINYPYAFITEEEIDIYDELMAITLNPEILKTTM